MAQLFSLGVIRRIKMKVIRYIILFSLLAICFGGLCTGFYFDWYFYTHSPRQPDASLGYIYPAIVHHGAKVYLSAEQWRWSESSYATTGYFTLFISAATGAFFLNRRWRLLGYDHDA